MSTPGLDWGRGVRGGRELPPKGEESSWQNRDFLLAALPAPKAAPAERTLPTPSQRGGPGSPRETDPRGGEAQDCRCEFRAKHGFTALIH